MNTINKLKKQDFNWDNKYQVKEMVENDIEMLLDVLLNEYDWETLDDVQDNIWEVVDGMGNVIYNYRAEKIARAFDMCPFEKSPITGDNFNSWNEMSFEVYYNELYNKVNNHFIND